MFVKRTGKKKKTSAGLKRVMTLIVLLLQILKMKHQRRRKRQSLHLWFGGGNYVIKTLVHKQK